MKKNILFGLVLAMAPAVSLASTTITELILKEKNFIQNNLTASNCSVHFKEFNDRLYHLKPQEIDLSHIQTEGSGFIKESFLTRLELKSSLDKMSNSQKVDDSCINEIRRTIREVRFLEEYVAQVSGLNHEYDVLQGESPYLLINPKFLENSQQTSIKLKSGDVLVSRGNAVVSAAIARIGDEKGQFSHAAMVYVDESTGITYAIEAHIEIGSDVAPIQDKYMNDGKVRVVVLRHKDAELAKKAAEVAFKRVKAGVDAGQRVPYDFAMDLSEEKNLFCSEIPYMAFKKASNGKVLLGHQYMTSFNLEGNTFLQGIGINVPETFAPSDAELDNQLELVAEWRDLGSAYKTHRKDATLTKIYSWMEKEGAKLDISQSKLMAYLSVFARRTPLMGELLKSSVAPNVTPKTIMHMMMMDKVGNSILDDLIIKYDQFTAKNTYPMTFEQMLTTIEELRTEDYARKVKLNEWARINPTADDYVLDRPEKPHFVDMIRFKK